MTDSSFRPQDVHDRRVVRLTALDTPAVSDAMDQLGLSSGVIAGLRPVSVARRIAGRVVTVAVGPALGRKTERHLGTAAVAQARPGDIIVVAHAGPEHVSGWGGLLSLAAALRGVSGIVVDGACRDADEMVDLDLPVYARATTPITARGRIIETGWNEPVVVAGIRVEPNDYVIADRSGTIVVPAASVDAVLTAAESIFRREAAMAEALRRGVPIDVALKSYESLLGAAS